MIEIINTERQVDTSILVQPFGDDGSVHITPVRGNTPGHAFILDAPAAAELAAFLLNGSS